MLIFPIFSDTWVVLVINLFVSIYGAIVIDGDRRGQYLTTMGVAILYLVCFMPGSLFCWFIPVYHAYRSEVTPQWFHCSFSEAYACIICAIVLIYACIHTCTCR